MLTEHNPLGGIGEETQAEGDLSRAGPFAHWQEKFGFWIFDFGQTSI
jgi:hypothetical protein